jgi:hypothetical protein
MIKGSNATFIFYAFKAQQSFEAVKLKQNVAAIIHLQVYCALWTLMMEA